MTDYKLRVPSNLLSSVLGEKDPLAELLQEVLNQVLEAQAAEQAGAGHYERSEARVAYRNGYRPRQLNTRVGPLAADAPAAQRSVDRDIRPVSAFRAGLGAVADGDGGQRRVDAQGRPDHRRAVRDVVFEVDGESVVYGFGCPGPGLQRAAAGVVPVLGVSHWQRIENRITMEWTVFDELAVISQTLRD